MHQCNGCPLFGLTEFLLTHLSWLYCLDPYPEMLLTKISLSNHAVDQKRWPLTGIDCDEGFGWRNIKREKNPS